MKGELDAQTRSFLNWYENEKRARNHCNLNRLGHELDGTDVEAYMCRPMINKGRSGFLTFSDAPLSDKNIQIFLAIRTNLHPVTVSFRRIFGHNSLVSYWLGQQDLASR